MDIGQRCAIDTGTTAGTILVLATNKRANVCLCTAVEITLRLPTQGFIIFAIYTTSLFTTTTMLGIVLAICLRQAKGFRIFKIVRSTIHCIRWTFVLALSL